MFITCTKIVDIYQYLLKLFENITGVRVFLTTVYNANHVCCTHLSRSLNGVVVGTLDSLVRFPTTTLPSFF